ncbi:MAG TPA: DUF4349 domain-containing protein [Allosphingosinicella sp.]|nr:DUF4349 domain-containing protein [Allosphingosinicella sp.]
MRSSLALVPLVLAIAACGGGQPDRSDGPASSDSSASNASDVAMEPSSAEERAAAGPNISPTAAPGVAFNYRYAFRLAAERVAEVQEQHAARCEQLGPERCRIVGLSFVRHDDENIEARLSFKLDPSIARIFGREGVSTVLRADGMLVESEISGTDVAPRIRQAGRSIAELREELARIEARLRGRLASGDKANLEYEAQQLRTAIRAAEQNRQEAQDTLATTPMTFVYGSGRYVPGPQPRRPVGETLEDAWENFVDGASILFVILVTLLPWALLALLVALAVRWVRRRFFNAPKAAPEPAAAPEA